MKRVLSLVLTLALILSVGFVLPVAADAPIELGYLHANAEHPTQENGQIWVDCDNSFTSGWQNWYAESADCVKLIKSGNDAVYNIASLTEYGTSDGIIVSNSGTTFRINNSQWNLNCANQSGTSPLAYGDTMIIGGNFTAASTGIVYHISTTYITKDADGNIHCSETFETGDMTPSVHANGFQLSAEYKCYDESGWHQFYASDASNVKMFRNGTVTNIGALTEYGTTDGIIYNLNGNELVLRNTQWALNCSGHSNLSPMQAGDVIYFGGTFTTSAGNTLHVKPTYMYMDAQGNLTTADAYNVGTLSADSTHPTKSGDDIYGIAEGGYNAGNWTEYKADSMDCVKLRKSGSDSYVSIGIPGSQNIMRKRGDNVFCVTNSQYYLNLAGHSELSPLAEGDVMIVEGNFTGVSDGITAHIERTYIYLDNGNLVFSTTEPVAETHTATAVAAAAPDCTNAGNSAYYYCYECDDAGEGVHYNKYYSDAALTTEIDPVIPASGHSWVIGAAVLPTCTEAGYTPYTCSVCGATKQENIVAALGHTLVYTDNGDGTHDATCSVCSTLVVDNEACTYENGVCTLCGATEVVADPNLVPELQFNSITLNIQSYIGVDFGVRTGGSSSVVKDYDSFYAVISVGSNDAVTYTASDFIAYNANLGYFELKSDGTQMTETITATLYAVKNGVTYHGNAVTYSVRSGLMENIASAKAADLTVERNRQYYTMLVDMLNYGAQAQLYFNNRTDDLANSELTSADQAYATSGNPTFTETASTSGTGAVTFKNFNLAVGSTIELNASITITGSGYAPTDLEAHITYGDTTEVVDCFGTGSKTAYMIYNTLPVTETRTTLTITIHAKNGGACVSNTWTGSLAALVPSIMSSKPEAVDLMNAMMKYADSCALYFN